MLFLLIKIESNKFAAKKKKKQNYHCWWGRRLALEAGTLEDDNA